MQFGSLQLESNLFLSPLAGYTNLPFRLVLREVGGLGLTTTDLVNARSLLERNPKALKLIETNEADSPLAVQLFGAVPEEMRDASQYLESIGIHSIDINMGCPVRKVCKTGGGSAMMTELDKTAHLVKMMVDSVSIPITAKMRLGWDDNNITAPNLVRVLEDLIDALLRRNVLRITDLPLEAQVKLFERKHFRENMQGSALNLFAGQSPELGADTGLGDDFGNSGLIPPDWSVPDTPPR